MKIRIAVAALAALGLAACGGPAPEAGPGSGPATTPGTQAHSRLLKCWGRNVNRHFLCRVKRKDVICAIDLHF